MSLVKSASRAFEILECFGRERRPLRLRDLVSELQHPTSSIAAILKSMTEQGYLTFDSEARSYIPAARLAQLVNWVPTDSFEQGVVLESMRTLQRRTKELIVLAVEAGIYLEYIETLRSSERLQLYVPPGTRRLLLQTATGWQFLSRRPKSEALELYRQTIAVGKLNKREFSESAFLEKIKRYGQREVCFIRARDLLRPVAHWGGGMISMLISVPKGHRPLAIGVGGPADRLEANIKEITTALMEEGAKIRRVVKRRLANHDPDDTRRRKSIILNA